MCTSAEGFVGILCDLFAPTVGFGTRLADTWAFLQTRFPYSLADSLTVVDPFVGSDPAIAGSVGMFPVGTPELDVLFVAIRGAATVVILAALVWFLIDRLTPQVTI